MREAIPADYHMRSEDETEDAMDESKNSMDESQEYDQSDIRSNSCRIDQSGATAQHHDAV